MTRLIKLKQGLDIRLEGAAEPTTKALPGDTGLYALVPDDFPGVKPKVVVKEGDRVKAGDALFVNKAEEQMTFASPVSGVVKQVERGERRKVLSVQVMADKEQQYKDFGVANPGAMSGSYIRQRLLDAGLFGFIQQLPYAVTASAESQPKAIFVSALRDMPLSADVEYELKGNEEAFQTGLTALSRMAKTYLGIGVRQTATALREAQNVDIVVFDGKCPAGNVGVQVNHIDPVNKGEVVWTVPPTAVIFIGRLFNEGRVNMRRTIAVAGSEVAQPCYYDAVVGMQLSPLLASVVRNGAEKVRYINGNPLTGTLTTPEGFLSARASEVTVIPEGDDADELLGWIMPRTGMYSSSRSYLSWLTPQRRYRLDARVKGGERHMIMSGEYDRVLPMDIYGEYLIKAIIAEDIDKMEALGIYEVAPEDFAVAEFVDSSKLPLQQIVRQGLDMLRKENE